MRRPQFRLFVCVPVVLLASPLWASPAIDNLSLRGLQAGGVTTLVIDGRDLLPDPKLLLGAPIASQTLKAGATPQRIEIDVALDAAVPPSAHQLRVATPAGISNPLAIAVDALPQTAFSAEIPALPVALTGSLSGGQTVATRFAGKTGELVAVEVEAQRLGAALDPVVRLYDVRGVQLAWGQPATALGGDARLQAKLPADGQYTIELHDALFQGGSPGFFRLKVGSLPFSDLAYPFGVKQGTQATLELLSFAGDDAGKVEFTAGHRLGPQPVPAPAGTLGSGPRVVVSELTEVVEGKETNPTPAIAAPAGINGRLSAAREEDRFTVAVTPGAKLRLDVLAERFGAPLDGVLTVYDDKGQQLATSDDRAGTRDPGFDLTVPDGLTSLVVALKDLQGRGGRQYVYRIEVAQADKPEFDLSLPDDRLEAPSGGVSVVRVEVKRTGFQGPIGLAFQGLPPGIRVEGGEIPAGADMALIALHGSGEPASGLALLIGKSLDPHAPLERHAQAPATPVSTRQAWLRTELAAAVTQPAPLGIAWGNIAGGAALPIGGALPLPVRIERRDGGAGAVRVALITSQVTPKKKIKENDQDKEVDDIDRTLRLEATPTIPADQAGGEVVVLVPADLPQRRYDLALRAELLGDDGMSVRATVFSPVLSLNAEPPFRLELAGEPKVAARAGLGETGKLVGRVVRSAGYTAPIKVGLANVPAEYGDPNILVEPGQTDFEFPVIFVYGAKPGELAGVTLVATSLDEGPLQSRSNEIAVAVTVTPGEKPPAEPPLAVFEDEVAFIGHLTSGGGTATFFPDDKYSGTASVKVTPDQRFNPALPGLGLKIREQPGPGEYRYLRYAWKKKGGSQLCLQLNHDGKWGPDGGPGKFRYHAGAGECFGASLPLQPDPPGEWTVVTRDLFADFGEFTLTGIALSPLDGEFGLFDHIYLGRDVADFELVKP